MNINFNNISQEEFRELERSAWNAVLDFSEFPAAEYKFFDTVQTLGMKSRREKIPPELMRGDIVKARRVYSREKEQLGYSLEMNRRYQSAILRSDELRCKIQKSRKPFEKLAWALECVELLTGEQGFAQRNLSELEVTP